MWARLLHGEHFSLCARQPTIPHAHILSLPLRVGLHAQIDAHVLSAAQRAWERRNEDRSRSVCVFLHCLSTCILLARVAPVQRTMATVRPSRRTKLLDMPDSTLACRFVLMTTLYSTLMLKPSRLRAAHASCGQNSAPCRPSCSLPTNASSCGSLPSRGRDVCNLLANMRNLH